MSHYAVAVFSNDADFDKLLDPYGETHKEYFVFKQTDYDGLVERYEKSRQLGHDMPMEKWLDVNGYVQMDGVWGYMHNPNGFYDYYSLDGKDYLFDIKPGAETDDTGYFRKRDYEWNAMDDDAIDSAEEFWDKYIATDKNGSPPTFYTRGYYLKRFKTKDQYVRERGRTVPYAFVTPDGKWHAPGRVGWFGWSDETAEDYNKYIEDWYAYIENDENPYVNLVDCHI